MKQKILKTKKIVEDNIIQFVIRVKGDWKRKDISDFKRYLDEKAKMFLEPEEKNQEM